MVLRRRIADGGEFLGCSSFPMCRGTRRLEESEWSSKPEVKHSGTTVMIPREILMSIIALCHPDRYPEERWEEANRITAILIRYFKDGDRRPRDF